MRHLRDIGLTIIGIAAMYWAADFTSDALWPWRESLGWVGIPWFDRMIRFLFALLVGAVLMKLLRWRFKVLAIVAAPVIFALIAPYWVYKELRDYGGEVLWFDTASILFIEAMTFVVGLLAGMLLVHVLTKRARPSAAVA